MPRVTALRSARPGRVRVELDGSSWRTVPLDVAARVGLSIGLELDRERLRTLRRELRAFAAADAAARSLARRDRSELGVRRVLERKGVSRAERDTAVATLRQAGAVDDERFARGRAAALADRGLGDAAIQFELEQEGLPGEFVVAAIAELAPEPDRATALAARRGLAPKTARWLSRRGFAADSIGRALPGIAEDEVSELG
jgi:SOS response regulatory protein OraA/RecX